MAKEIYFSTDVLADILRRLPPVSRRRARLVCRHWRDVINKYTTEMQSRPTTLIWNVNFAVAYVLGADLSSSSSSSMGSCLELWKRPTTSIYPKRKDVYLVGSCNGLICMCDNEERTGGAVTVVNPATGETSAVPPLPFSRLFIGSHGRKLWHKAYNFAYHPKTGKYKVVHVPYSCERVFEFQTVQVFTLGETKWRQVPAPADARCDLAAGVLTIDGMTHWVRAGGAPRIMSFDLDAEHVASTRMGLPKLTDGRESYQLTEVHGRLGLVATSRDVWDTSSDVWVLEKGQRWSHRYNLEHFVPMPHFVYREHVLTWRRSSFYTHQRKSTPPSSGWRLRSESDNVVCINNQDEGTLVADMTQCPGNLQTFAYVETMEPLSVYVKNWN